MYNYELFQYKNFLKMQSFCTPIQKLYKNKKIWYNLIVKKEIYYDREKWIPRFIKEI